VSIPTSCPSCHQTFRVVDDAIGKKVKCPACAHLFVVATVIKTTLAKETSPKPASRKPAAPSAAPQDDDDAPFEIAGATCGGCGAKLDPAAQFCVDCGTYVATGAKLEVEAATGKKEKASRKKTMLIVSAVVLGVIILVALTAFLVFR
jgi:predicted Zn finger-like uncharacterized protein